MAGHQNAKKGVGFRYTSLGHIFDRCQSVGIQKKNDQFTDSLENHAKIDKNRRLSNKKYDSSHDVHRPLMRTKDYSIPSK